jgi:hypothetical protein
MRKSKNAELGTARNETKHISFQHQHSTNYAHATFVPVRKRIGVGSTNFLSLR